jgi:hypothetical protein
VAGVGWQCVFAEYPSLDALDLALRRQQIAIEQQDKFIATVQRYRKHERWRATHRQTVSAVGMAVRIIDLLEAVEVE